MIRKFALCSLAAMLVFSVLSFSSLDINKQSLACLACGSDSNVVDKVPCEAFTVNISFKNTGRTEGTWFVNIAFEGESWTWNGTPQILTLKPSKTKTLIWNGNVPCDAPIDSITRLILYYNDSFTPLNWWIHIVSDAELTITSSAVK
ncbi:MAG: hypothetical protein QXH37_04680 [Candidatus Bathyarchaeia archaeon]